MKEVKIRLQKHLSTCGIASRRKAEEMILAGKVKVNGRIATLGDKVDPRRDKIMIAGKRVALAPDKMYVMLHKPRGYVTTLHDEHDRRCVAELVEDCGQRLFPVGRLDKDSEGLLIMTNDGELSNLLTHPSRHVSKVYRVTVREKVTEEQLLKLTAGIVLDGKKTAPCEVKIIQKEDNRTVLSFTIFEGRNRQIRRMCEQVGLNVIRLKRMSMAGVKLGMLPTGKWRELNEKELNYLMNVSSSKSGEEESTEETQKKKRYRK